MSMIETSCEASLLTNANRPGVFASCAAAEFGAVAFVAAESFAVWL
jgi:hypothetical protein